MKEQKKQNIIVIVLLILAIILISVAIPPKMRLKHYDYTEGKPWLYDMLKAPFEIPIERDAASQQRITDSVEANFVRIYTRDNTLQAQQEALLSKALVADGVTTLRSYIVNKVAEVYNDGIVENATADRIAQGKMPHVRILSQENVATVIPTSSMRSVRQAYEYLDSTLANYRAVLNAVGISNFLKPNMTLDTIVNDKYLKNDLNQALAPSGIVQPGEAIIFPGNIVTPQKYAILQTYERMMEERNPRLSSSNLTFVGQIVIVAIMLIAFYVFMRVMRHRVFADLRRMIFLISFITIFIIAVFFFTSWRPMLLYVIPFALLAIIVTTFFDARTAFFVHMVVVLICSLVVDEQAEFIIIQFLAGCIAIVSMQEFTKRSQLVGCAFAIFVACCVSYAALTLVRTGNFTWDDCRVFPKFAVSSVILSFAYFVIFLVEKMFGFTSTVKLVELSDINTPVLRALSEDCPGTFQHSLQVANLASEAALKVGANQQLARAGALYHDIGKIDNPAFFTENQSGVNPHDSLDPEQSARIVIRHVTDGIKRAERAHLPQVIKDLIAQHHGRGITRYFYTQACKAHPNETVDREPYTYPGPNPQTKEAAILMMADSCEAAAKSMTDHSEKAIRAMVDKIINSQIADGLLKDSPISLRDIERIKIIFTDRLRSLYYTRISYPDDVKPAASDEAAASAAPAEAPATPAAPATTAPEAPAAPTATPPASPSTPPAAPTSTGN